MPTPIQYENFDPSHFKKLRARAAKEKHLRSDLILSIAQAEEHSAQAELNLITRADLAQEVAWRKRKMKGAK